MATKAALLTRLEQLESASVTVNDAWWRQMCERYGFAVIPMADATRDDQLAVFDAYLDDFY